MWCLRQEELLHLSIHNTCLGRNRILVVLWTIILLSKVKLCKSCLKTCNWFVVWLRRTSEFFHLLSHLLRLEKGCSGSLFFPFNPLNPKSEQYQISPCNSDALKTELWWELRTGSHKMYLLDILSTSPHNFYSKWIGATKENFNLDLRV